jgi:hypothetical protein
VLIFQSLWETVESVNKNMADWQLTSCCSHTQVAFIATIGAFIFVILALWRTPVLDPFKLITVFLHEASHATACKLTGGKVEGMEVKADEGGVTHTRGGYQWFILPAGCKDSSDQHMDVRSYLDLKLYGLDFTEHLQL